jgi:membrane protease YdiL (CAAX protease family)
MIDASAPRLESRVAAAAAFAFGAAFLASRSVLVGRPDSGVLFAGGYAVVLATAVGARVPAAGRPRPSGATAIAVGLVGVAAVTFVWAVTGPRIAAPTVAWAPAFNVLAALAEEALFRRLAFGWLERYGSFVAVVASGLAFALVHLPVYGSSALPVDLGAGLLLSWQRAASGRWSVPAATHAAANLVVMLG